MSKYFTLNEYQEHLKQSRDYDLEDEVIKHKCFECNDTFYQCDMTRWKFEHYTRQHWFCQECFKLNKGYEDAETYE